VSDERSGRSTGPLPGWLAIALVTGTSAAVLVLEILAGRLLAPYVGVSLESYTGIIGTVLVGMAAGARLGGWAADRWDPHHMLPALTALGGALALTTLPVVRVLGASGGGGVVRIVVLTGCGVLPAVSVLSAVPPTVVKLQLRDLAAAGNTVGRLSAYGTVGAIGGTFLTGFVLVAWAAVSTLIVTVGVLLVLAGAVLWLVSLRRSRRVAAAVSGAAGLAAVALVGVAAVDGPCRTNSRYYCISVEVDPWRPSGRVLVMDDLRHSYVDLADPTHLEFWYTRAIVAAIDTFAPSGAVDAVHVGGGAMTVPRAVRAARPGSGQVVFEIDPDLVELAHDELGLEVGGGLDVRVGDGRAGLRSLPSASADVVVGDAFGSRAVPWHLATTECVEEVARVLRPGGVYVVNVIDEPGRLFLRAEVATIAAVLPYVIVWQGPHAVAGQLGNSVIVASDTPIDAAALAPAVARFGPTGALVEDVRAFSAGAVVLDDDFAPVDQLIARGG